MSLFLLLKKQTHTSFLDPFFPLLHLFAPFTTKLLQRLQFPFYLLQSSLELTPSKLLLKVTNKLQTAKSSGLISAFLLFGLPPTSNRCPLFPNTWFFMASPGLHHLLVFFLSHQSLTFQSPFLVPLFLDLSEAHPVNFYFNILHIWLLSYIFLFPKASPNIL